MSLGFIASQGAELEASKAQGLLVVISMDIDGCLFSRQLVDRLREEKFLKSAETFLPPPFSASILIHSNNNLVKDLTNSIIPAAATQVKVLSGSNRQSHYLDTLNGRIGGCGKGTGSSFPALKDFAAELNKRLDKAPCHFDPFLLADLYNKLECGKSLEESLSLNKQRTRDSEFQNESFVNHSLNDLTKMPLVYAQIHHVFSQTKSQTGVYHFFDDKQEILTYLQDIYERFPGLLPQGVTLPKSDTSKK